MTEQHTFPSPLEGEGAAKQRDEPQAQDATQLRSRPKGEMSESS
jgi:hypothetical protein